MNTTTVQPPGPITIDPTAIYTTYAVAWLMGVSPASILAAIRRGELPAVRRGHCTYLTGRALLAWLSPTDAAKDAVDKATRA